MQMRSPAWAYVEMLGVAKNRVVSIMDCPVEQGSVWAQVVSNKHNIYVAPPC